MSHQLACNVALSDPNTGESRVYVAGETLPDWAVALVTNPKVFHDDATDQPTASEPSSGEPVNDTSGVGTDSDPQPPRAGKGSNVDAWRDWAARNGIAVPDNANRADIIAAVDAASG